MLRRGCRCACGTPWSFSQHLSPPGGGSRHHPAACAVAQVLTGEGSSHGRVPWFPVHVWCISAGAILYHSAYAPPEATCEEPEESSQDSKSNSHTAKFTIFCDKARRAAAEERYEEAEKWWEMARQEAVEGFGEDDGHMAVIQNGLADVLRRQGGARFAQAEALYTASLRTTERVYGKADVRYAQALQNLGQYWADAGRHHQGLRHLEQALAVKERIFGKLHIECARVKAVIADVHHGAGSHAKAVAGYQQSLDVLRALGQDEGSVAAGIQRRLVAALLAKGSPEEALAVVTAMLPYARNVHITEHSTAMHCLETVVDALARRGDTTKAIPAAEAMLKARTDALPAGHANIALAQLVLAQVLLGSKDSSHHGRGLAAAMACVDGLRRAAKALHTQAQQAAQPQWSIFGGGAKDASHPAFARLRANASAVEYGRAVNLCVAPTAMSVASQEEVQKRVVVKADRMRRETLTQLLQSIINHPSIATVLEVSKDDLAEQMRRSQHDS